MIAWIILKRAAFSGNNFNTGRNPKFPGQGNLMKSAGTTHFLLMAGTFPIPGNFDISLVQYRAEFQAHFLNQDT